MACGFSLPSEEYTPLSSAGKSTAQNATIKRESRRTKLLKALLRGKQ
jgi:hypothetical protein